MYRDLSYWDQQPVFYSFICMIFDSFLDQAKTVQSTLFHVFDVNLGNS